MLESAEAIGSWETSKLKELAKSSFNNQAYGHAVELYSKILEHDPNNTDILSNRALAYLNLGCDNNALNDTNKVLGLNPTHEKCIYRKVKSLWGLGKYDEASDFLNNNIPLEILDNPDFSYLKEQTPKMLKQSKGQFEIMDILNLPKEKRVDLAEFTGPVEVGMISTGKGQGLLAKMDINPGQLLICSKAFAISFDKNRNLDPFYHEQLLVTNISKKLNEDPTARPLFDKLYAGPELDDANSEENCLLRWATLNIKGVTNLADRNRVKYNCFRSAWNSHGIWILPSFLNHSCMDSNAFWTVHGDSMIVRAGREIKSGEEITIAYTFPQEQPSRLKMFSVHNFKCDCRLCELERSESAQTCLAIQKTLQSIREASNKTDKTTLMDQVERVKKLISLRDGNPTVNLALLDINVLQVVNQLVNSGEWKFATEICAAVWNICTNSCSLAEKAVDISGTLINCYIEMGNLEEAEKWAKCMNKDLIVAYGMETADWDLDKLEKIFNPAGKEISLSKSKRIRLISILLFKCRVEPS